MFRSHTHACFGRVSRQNHQLSRQPPPPDAFTMEIHVHNVQESYICNSSTPIEVLLQPIPAKSVLVPRHQLQSDETSRLVISDHLCRLGITEDCGEGRERFIQRFCNVAASMIMTSEASNNGGCAQLTLVVEILILMTTRWYDEAEATAMAISESVESLKLKPVPPATKSSIEGLEKVRVEGFVGSMEQCMICLENFSDGLEVIRMPCLHVYHGNCIVQWLQISHACPLCRFPLPCSD